MVRAENFLLNHICETDVQYVKEPRELGMGPFDRKEIYSGGCKQLGVSPRPLPHRMMMDPRLTC